MSNRSEPTTGNNYCMISTYKYSCRNSSGYLLSTAQNSKYNFDTIKTISGIQFNTDTRIEILYYKKHRPYFQSPKNLKLSKYIYTHW